MAITGLPPPPELRRRLDELLARRTGLGELDWRRFRELKTHLGWTQEDLGDVLGVDRASLAALGVGAQDAVA